MHMIKDKVITSLFCVKNDYIVTDLLINLRISQSISGDVNRLIKRGVTFGHWILEYDT